jgi:hypothetical protein
MLSTGKVSQQTSLQHTPRSGEKHFWANSHEEKSELMQMRPPVLKLQFYFAQVVFIC